MRIYKRELRGMTSSGRPLYNYYPVDITDYFFVEYSIEHPVTREYHYSTYIYSWLTDEPERLYVIDPYDNQYHDLCGGSYSIVLEKYWKLMHRSI